jgi:hypothetical protein
MQKSDPEFSSGTTGPPKSLQRLSDLVASAESYSGRKGAVLPRVSLEHDLNDGFLENGDGRECPYESGAYFIPDGKDITGLQFSSS